jgi:hypothetical protein
MKPLRRSPRPVENQRHSPVCRLHRARFSLRSASLKHSNEGWVNLTCLRAIQLFRAPLSYRCVVGIALALGFPGLGWSSEKSPTSPPVKSVEESIERGQIVFYVADHAYDANAQDGATGDALQQTLIEAFFYGQTHNGARVTVAAPSDDPTYGSRILIPGNVDLVCSSYSPQTYTGGCGAYQTDLGSNTATGGSPLFLADYSIGVLADHKTWCSLFDNPQKPGCIIIDSSGGSMSGFTLYGGGERAGGADVGIRVAADNFHVQDTAITGFFGGPGIQHIVGVNDSYDWNYGTNVNTWWCANPVQFTSANLHAALLIGDGFLGGIDLPMVDGEASHNQYSTGCAFSKGFTVSLEYPHLAAMHVGGSGNLIAYNLAQADGIGLAIDGQEQRVLSNRSEYHAREGIFSNANNSTFSGNIILSACLDPNLGNLRPGAPNNGVPTYPRVPTSLHPGHIIMDTNGNIEQVVSASGPNNVGTSEEPEPDWPDKIGQTVSTGEVVWENIGPWKPGLTASTDTGPTPALTSGLCYGVFDIGQNNIWNADAVGEEAGVNGPSYDRGSYFIPFPGSISADMCDRDQPDANGNGQCWWGGDWFSNGGPPNMSPNGKMISASGGGTAWVGDYSVLLLTDATSHQYNNFQGMSTGQFFWVTSSDTANVINSWSVNGNGWSWYGHPSLLTCGGVPLTVAPNQYYEFYYNENNPWMVTQVNCPSETLPPSGSASLTLSLSSLTFAAQTDGTHSAPQTVTLTNSGTATLANVIAASGDFSQANTCGTSVSAGATCTVSVTFTPTSPGTRLGVLTFTDNVSNSRQTVALSGQGEAIIVPPQAAIDVSATTAGLTITSAGGTAAAPVAVYPEGGFTGNVKLACVVTYLGHGVPNDLPTCTLGPAQLQINGNVVGASTLTVSTTSPTTSVAIDQPVGRYKAMFAGLFLLALFPRRRWRANLSMICVAGIGLSGCGLKLNYGGSSASTQGTTMGNYQVTVNATSGSLKASAVIPLRLR